MNEEGSEGRNLDSLTDQEKEELDQSLGSDLGPEELPREEQEKLEEMALEGVNKEEPGQSSTFPKKAEPFTSAKKADISQPPYQKEEKKETADSGRHPDIASRGEVKKPQVWQPKPIKVDQSNSDSDGGSKSFNQADFSDKPQHGGESVLKYVGLTGATILAVVIIFFALAFVDAKGYLNLGVNQICTSIGMENGCLPFVGETVNPIAGLTDARKAFQETSSHQFEAEFNIELVNSEDSNVSPIVSGTAKGAVTSEGADVSIALDQASENDQEIYNDLVSNLIQARYLSDGGLYLKSEGFGFDQGTIGVTEDDFLTGLEFLSLTSGGINNVTQESQGQLDKYQVVVDPTSVVDDTLGQADSVTLTLYVNASDDLPQEIDFDGNFANGRIVLKKRFLEYNSVNSLANEFSSEDQATAGDMIGLVVNMKKTDKERDAIRKEDLAQIQSALEAYNQDNDQYPKSNGLDMIGQKSSIVSDALVPDYITKMPFDPLFDRYFYGYVSDGESYNLTAVLENAKDSEAVKTGELNLYKLTSND